MPCNCVRYYSRKNIAPPIPSALPVPPKPSAVPFPPKPSPPKQTVRTIYESVQKDVGIIRFSKTH